MLVNINLLPQKEKKSFSHYILAAVSVVLLLGGGLYLYLQYQSLQVQLSTAQQQLTTTQKLREMEEQKSRKTVSSSSSHTLEQMIQWMEKQPVSTVVVLHHLAAALPKHGLFLNYQYVGEGTVNLSVQFDVISEVSAYLHQLEKDTIIQEVKLTNVNTTPVTPESKENAVEDVQYMPRYQAQFQIKLNMEKVKEEKGEEK